MDSPPSLHRACLRWLPIVYLVAAFVLLTLCFAPTARASTPSIFKGPGTVTIATGATVPAWTWNGATSTWSTTPYASATSVYVWPWTADWTWTWTPTGGWRAVSQRHVFALGEQTTRLMENFSGGAGAAPANANWKIETGPYGYARDACFNARNVTTDGAGNLVITGRKESSAGCTRAYTAGSIDGRQSFGPPKPGQVITFDARMKAPCGSGQWPAFWTTGEGSSWPQHGEIDMVEIYGNRPLEAAHDQHAAMTSGGSWHQAFRQKSATPWCNAFHTYGVRWSQGRLDFTIDGRVTVSRSRSDFQAGRDWPFDVYPQNLKLNLALGGGEPGTIDNAMLPSRMLVDWVRVTSN